MKTQDSLFGLGNRLNVLSNENSLVGSETQNPLEVL